MAAFQGSGQVVTVQSKQLVVFRARVQAQFVANQFEDVFGGTFGFRSDDILMSNAFVFGATVHREPNFVDLPWHVVFVGTLRTNSLFTAIAFTLRSNKLRRRTIFAQRIIDHRAKTGIAFPRFVRTTRVVFKQGSDHSHGLTRLVDGNVLGGAVVKVVGTIFADGNPAITTTGRDVLQSQQFVGFFIILRFDISLNGTVFSQISASSETIVSSTFTVSAFINTGHVIGIFDPLVTREFSVSDGTVSVGTSTDFANSFQTAASALA